MGSESIAHKTEGRQKKLKLAKRYSAGIVLAFKAGAFRY